MKRRRWLLIAVPAIAALATYFGASVVLYERMSTVEPQCDGQFGDNTPARFSAVPFASDLDTSPYFMPDYETVSIASRDPGINLSGWHIASDTPNAPAVLVVHGLGVGTADCKRHPRALLPAGMLYRAGFNLLLIDLREHGDSTVEDGKWAAGTEEYRDVLGAWDWLQTQKGFAPDQIGLYAYSGGTGPALIAMGEEPGIAAAWLDSPFADINTAISDRLEQDGYPRFLTAGGILAAQVLSGDDLDALTPVAEAAKVEQRPVFIAHCEADSVLPATYAYTLAEALRLPPERLWIAPGCDHVRAVFQFPDEYARRLGGFFEAALRH